MFSTSHVPDNPWYQPEDFAELMRDRIRNIGGLIGDSRDHITNSKQVVYKPMEVAFVNKSWFNGCVVLIGDAAHAKSNPKKIAAAILWNG